jgi:anti-anti-sigma regulatory factor
MAAVNMQMKPLNVRAELIILLLLSVVIGGGLLVASVPIMLDLTPRLQRIEVINYLIYLPILFVVTTAVALWWLRPVWRLTATLQSGGQPSQEMLRAARRSALTFPYRFFILVSALIVCITITVLTIDVVLLDYPPQKDFLNAMMIISVGLCIALVLFVGSRRILHPVLALAPGTTVEGRGLSVRGKILWTILVLTVANLLFLSAFGYTRSRRAADDSLLAHYRQVVDRLAGAIAPSLGDQELLAQLAALSLGDGADFVLLDDRGQFVTSPPSLTLLAEEVTSVTSGARGTLKREESDVRLVYAPLPDRSQYLLATYVFDPTTVPSLQTGVRVLLVFGLGACVFVIVIGYLIAEDTVSDLRRVTQQLTEVVAGEELRIPQLINVTSRDEVSQLVVAFNLLRDRIVSHTEELQLTLRELQEANERQRQLAETVSDLSVPVIPLSPGVIVLPLVGYVDDARARQLTKGLLRGVADHRAQVAIIDLTGLSLRVEVGIAHHLVRASRAVRLAGAEVVLTGVPTEMARMLVKLALDLSGVTVRRDLQEGIEYALTRVGAAAGRAQ